MVMMMVMIVVINIYVNLGKYYFPGTGITLERVLQARARHPSWDVTSQNLSDHHLRVDFDPYMDMGRILPEYSDSEEENEFVSHGDVGYDAESYLTADDPSTWEYEQQWMS